jgi:predicted PurR-regulated permease PerM
MDLHQAAQDSTQKNLWKQITLYLLIIGAVATSTLILYPFLPAIIGAIVLAVITQRPYNWLTRKIRNRNISATLALILVVVSVIIPIFFLAQDLVQGTGTVIVFLRSDVPQRTFTGFLIRYPTLAADLQTVSNSFDLQSTVRSIAAYIGALLAGLLSHSFGAVIQIVMMLFILFFLYRDQEMAISFARSLLPLSDNEADELLESLRLTIYATALGRLALAAIEGVLAGAAFWILGVPNTMLWTLATVIVGILPAVGASVVWIPIALYLGFTGHWGKAALLAAWGTFILSTIDNFLYPVFVGSRLSQHTISIVLSMLGGVAFFGLSGLILGPIAFTIATTLLDFWRRRTITSAQQLATEPPS